MRAADVQTRVEDSGTIAALVEALVFDWRRATTLQEAVGSGAARLGAIETGDLMAVRGDPEAVAELAAELVLSPADAAGVKFEAGLFTTASGLAEVIVPPRSTLIGERLFPGMVTPSGNLVVLAIHRQGHDLPPGEALEKGDTLLLQGTWEALETYIAPPEALVVDSPELVRRQVVPMGRQALVALGIMTVMVLLLATGLVPRPPPASLPPAPSCSSASSASRKSTARSTGRR